MTKRIDRYLKIVNWARDRDTINGTLPLTRRARDGSIRVARWLRIEALAYDRYLA